MEQFEGRTAVITGGASGIGRALAEQLAGLGMRLVLADVDGDALAGTEADLRAQGADVTGRVTDVTDADDVAALADHALDRFDAVHVLCANAGVFAGGLLWERPRSDLDWVLGVNLHGVLHTVRAFVPRMLAAGDEGHVVVTSSSAGLFGSPYTGPYTISKFAAFAVAECLAWDLSITGSGIGVSVVCPGAVDTAIGTSDRNRPSSLGAERSDDARLVEDALRSQTGAGMSAAEVADQVVDAIRDRRFLVLTSPGYDEALRGRTAALLAGELPPLIGFD